MDSTPTSNSLSQAAYLLTAEELNDLRRTIVITNGKGGVGKTSVTTNLATLFADADYKVLVVDLDSQANVAVNLGFLDDDRNDHGRSLYTAVTFGEIPVPSKNIRPGLDVLSAGRYTAQLFDAIRGDSLRGGSMRGGVARAIAKIAPEYDIILIDTPPSDAGYIAVDEAMLASRWIIAPLRPEPKSIKGLYSLADRIEHVQESNPYIRLLGVVLFGVPSGATRVEQRPREILGERLEGIAPTFQAKIRNVVAADADASFRGESAHELAAEVAKQGPFWKRLRDGKSSEPVLAGSASSLSEDYMSLAAEIVNELQTQEEAIEAQEVQQ